MPAGRSHEDIVARARAQPDRLVPVACEVLLDADTPVGAYARLRESASISLLLESAVGGERWGRWSFLALGHRARIVGRVEPRDGAATLVLDVEPGPGFSLPPPLAERSRREGLTGLREIHATFTAAPWQPDEGAVRGGAWPPFWGGLVGAFGHDFVRAVERLPVPAHHPAPPLPAVDLVVTDLVVAFDNLSQRVTLITAACARDDGGPEEAVRRAQARLDALRTRLLSHVPASRPRPLPLDPPPEEAIPTAPAPPHDATAYRGAVARAREHIVAGDIFQVVLSQRFDMAVPDVDPFDVYRLLRLTNPAPYMVMLELPSATVVGASPESLVRLEREGRRMTVRPIAGTRPRGVTPAADLALERELLADEKERAEHVMLIDLGRNDVGRVCVGGTVEVTERFGIERYSRVMHIVSEVQGELGPGLDALDALAAAFPAGTLSGAPKVRALQIIDALEPAGRGYYGGAVGYLGFDGGADFAICIRTAVFRDGVASVQAGGGIVYDSTPELEDAESRNKASAVLRAIAMAAAATRGSERPA